MPKTWQVRGWYARDGYVYEVIDVRWGWAAAWVWKEGKLLTVTAVKDPEKFTRLKPGEAEGDVLDLWNDESKPKRQDASGLPRA